MAQEKDAGEKYAKRAGDRDHGAVLSPERTPACTSRSEHGSGRVAHGRGHAGTSRAETRGRLRRIRREKDAAAAPRRLRGEQVVEIKRQFFAVRVTIGGML